MRIRILVGMPDGAVLHGRPWPAVGDTVDDLPTAVAAHLVASEVAEQVADTPTPTRRTSKKGGNSG